MLDNKEAMLDVQPHQVDWYTRLKGLFKGREHPSAADQSADDADDMGGMSETAKWWRKQFSFPGSKERAERYRIFEEMDTFGLVQSVLDLYSEEVTQPDYDTQRSVWIESPSSKMVKAGNECLQNCMVEDHASPLVREMSKLGDTFRRLIYQTGKGVLGWKHVPAAQTYRLEDKYSRLVGFRQDGQTFRHKKSTWSWPWDYVHFRLLGKDIQTTYGSSMLEPLFRPWRQLALSEDAMLMYRLRRAPDRNMVLVDVGDMEEAEAMKFVNAWRKKFRKHEYIDPASPDYRKSYNPLTPLEDVFMPIRGGDNNSQISQMSGSSNVGDIYDVEHFVNVFFGTARVPKAIMGFEGDINAKCLDLETPIPCLDGKERTLQEIIDTYESTGELPWVYSYDGKTGKVVPGEVEWAGVTKRDTEVVEVELDDGSKHVCTPDHRWFLLDGTEVEAAKLEPGVQLRTLRRLKKENGLVSVSNHTVLAVRVLTERRDTGDITVKGLHNFFIADATNGGVLVHNSTLMQQDVRFARTGKRIRKGAIQGFRTTCDIHYTLLPTDPENREYDFTQKGNEYVVQMSPISYLDEWERLELIQLRYQIVDAMANLAQTMQINPKVWGTYILLNYAKLPADLVTKLVAKTPQGGEEAGFESSGLTPQQRLKVLQEHGPEMLKTIVEPMDGGYGVLTPVEEQEIATAIHNSPPLRKVIGNLAYYFEDEISTNDMIAQTDPRLLPPMSLGIIIEDNFEDEKEAKKLQEDLKELRDNTLTERNEGVEGEVTEDENTDDADA